MNGAIGGERSGRSCRDYRSRKSLHTLSIKNEGLNLNRGFQYEEINLN
jgi:hypothetical protein